MIKLMVVGEAWGQEEAAARRPFVGPSGKLLRGLLRSAGIDPRGTYMTNVFNLQPKPTNDIANLCGPQATGIKGMKAIAPGKYVRAEYDVELHRLWREVEEVKPNLILGLGNTALWALVRGAPYISKQRGTIMQSHTGPKMIATYHPAAVLRQWSWKPIVMADLQKVRREQEYPDIRLPRREVWVQPTLGDLVKFNELIEASNDLSVDIETSTDQITCIGFAPTPSVALVVPFVDPREADGNYWRTKEEEIEAWCWVRQWCGLQRARYVGQNFLYDAHFLYRKHGIVTRHTHDTMLLHHALQPEMEKGLGFLGSIYTSEQGWKIMRGKTETAKKEDL